jgi:tRNA(fMet)-specific endonuclease VapC
VILLDTDIVSLLLRYPDAHPQLVRRIRETPLDDIYISAVTVAEIMEGGLALIRKLQPKDQESVGYELLVNSFHYLNRFAVLAYDSRAEQLFHNFSPHIRRQGRQDCQIAAIALTHEATVITRNERHFAQIPGVVFENWVD